MHVSLFQGCWLYEGFEWRQEIRAIVSASFFSLSHFIANPYVQLAIPVSEQQLSYLGTALDQDGMTLLDYGINCAVPIVLTINRTRVG